jgi:hypothetical protein
LLGLLLVSAVSGVQWVSTDRRCWGQLKPDGYDNNARLLFPFDTCCSSSEDCEEYWKKLMGETDCFRASAICYDNNAPNLNSRLKFELSLRRASKLWAPATDRKPCSSAHNGNVTYNAFYQTRMQFSAGGGSSTIWFDDVGTLGYPFRIQVLIRGTEVSCS